MSELAVNDRRAYLMPMHIYLVQHGEAKPEAEDPGRHLTERGLQDVKKVAEFLRPLQVQAIWHSGKARAEQTAEILAATITTREVVQKEGLAPKDPVGVLKQGIERLDQDIMIVGHLPFLSKLAGLMVAGDETKEVVAFQYGGVACLELLGGSWKIDWMIVPGLLE
jgi:phosphohistidine phosphatase